MFFGAHSIIFETLFVFAGKITFRFSPRALFDLPDLRHSFTVAFAKENKSTLKANSSFFVIRKIDGNGKDSGKAVFTFP